MKYFLVLITKLSGGKSKSNANGKKLINIMLRIKYSVLIYNLLPQVQLDSTTDHFYVLMHVDVNV